MEKRNVSYRKSRKFAKQMSDEDLNAAIDRLKREETYRQLVSKDKTEKAIRREHKRANKEEVKQTKALKKAQEPTKPKNQNDGVLKKSVKEALGGGIKTMGNAGFQALAKTVFPEKSSPKIEYTKTKDGWLAKVTGGTEEDVRKTETFLSNLLNTSVSDIDTSTKTTAKNASATTSISNNPGTSSAYAVPKDENRNRLLKNVWNTGYDEIQDSWD